MSDICPACDFVVFVVKRYWFFDGGASPTLRFYSDDAGRPFMADNKKMSGICPACDFEVFVVKRYWFFDGGASPILRFYFSHFL